MGKATERYKDPATVVAESGLEQHLRKVCAEGAAWPAPEEKMKQWKYPVGWDEERVRRVLEHYEAQSDEEAVAEDEAAYEATTHK